MGSGICIAVQGLTFKSKNLPEALRGTVRYAKCDWEAASPCFMRGDERGTSQAFSGPALPPSQASRNPSKNPTQNGGRPPNSKVKALVPIFLLHSYHAHTRRDSLFFRSLHSYIYDCRLQVGFLVKRVPVFRCNALERRHATPPSRCEL